MEAEDYYAHHLAQVNKSNTVHTTEDVVNQQGAIIVPKGTPINNEIVVRIATHKLKYSTLPQFATTYPGRRARLPIRPTLPDFSMEGFLKRGGQQY